MNQVEEATWDRGAPPRAPLLPLARGAAASAHEPVHLRERYHTDAFWARLARVIPGYEERRRR